MPRHLTHPRLPTLTLLALLLVAPTLATAHPLEKATRAAVEHSAAAPDFLSRLWDLLSAVWATGSGLDPNGSDVSSGPGTGPGAASSGDTGSILDPNG
jgi:hypothetical protein